MLLTERRPIIMKLFGKMTLMSLAMTVTASFGFLSPMLVGGATHGVSYSAPVIELTAYTPTYNIDEAVEFTAAAGQSVSGSQYGYRLPKAEVTGSASFTVTAKDSTRRAANVVLGTDDLYYLVTTKSGLFEIFYEADNNGVKTTTKNVMVEIVTNGAELRFPANSAQIIPTIAYLDNKITFPKVEVVIDGEVNVDASKKVTVVLTDALGNQKASFSQNSDTPMEYTIVASDAGDYLVKYTYTEGSFSKSITETFRVNTNEQDIELNYADSLTSKLESLALEVGVEVDLPKPTVVNSAANDANVSDKVYTVITVKDPDGEEQTITDFKFTPNKPGNYRFSYVSTDFYGNSCTLSLQRDGIKLTGNSIEVKVVEAYDKANVATMDIDTLKSAEYDIDSEVYILSGQDKVVAEFPAIFAKGGWGDYDNLQLVRTVWKNGNKIGTLEIDHSVNGATKKYAPNEIGMFEFTTEGSYEIYYQAKYLNDEGEEISSTQKSLSSFKFEVKKVDVLPSTTDTNLTIKAPSLSTTAVLKNSESTITFNAPVVSDDIDDRVEVNVTYSFNGVTGTFDATKEDDGSYSIQVVKPASVDATAWAGVNTMTITFSAKNFLDHEQSIVKTVSLLDYSADAYAPKLNTANAFASYDNTNKEITLPEISFTDTATEATKLSLVMYVIKDGKVVDTFNGVSDNDTHTAVLETFKYEPTQEGMYQFVYVATDQNYNTTTHTLECDVDFALGYSVTIEEISTKEYGDVLDLTSVITVTQNGEVVDFDNEKVVIKSVVTESDVIALANDSLLIQVDGAYKEVSGGSNGTIVCLEGNINVKAWAKDSNGVCDYVNNASSQITIKSADTIKPEFTIEGESQGNKVIASYEYGDTSAENTHVIPWFESIIDEGTGVNEDSLKIELTYANSSTPFKTFTLNDANTVDGLQYTVTQEGKIKVVYSVADNVKGNTTTREFWIHVGDVLAPEIVIANDAIVTPAKVGEQFSIALDKIDFANDASLSKTEDLKVKVTCNGNDVTAEFDDDKENIIFTASEAGTYVITFDITDGAGNEATTVTKTITIKNATSAPVNTSTVWGTIMIVVALVVVGLVVFFFVKPSRTKKLTDKKTK